MALVLGGLLNSAILYSVEMYVRSAGLPRNARVEFVDKIPTYDATMKIRYRDIEMPVPAASDRGVIIGCYSILCRPIVEMDFRAIAEHLGEFIHKKLMRDVHPNYTLLVCLPRAQTKIVTPSFNAPEGIEIELSVQMALVKNQREGDQTQRQTSGTVATPLRYNELRDTEF